MEEDDEEATFDGEDDGDEAGDGRRRARLLHTHEMLSLIHI